MFEMCKFLNVDFHEDDRRQSITDIVPEMPNEQINVSYIPAKSAIVWGHWHKKQIDYWCVLSGQLKVLLADVNTSYVPNKNKQFFYPRFTYLSDKNIRTLKIPPGVVHGYQNISDKPAILLYYLSRKYNSAADEYRVPWDYFGKDFWEIKNK